MILITHVYVVLLFPTFLFLAAITLWLCGRDVAGLCLPLAPFFLAIILRLVGLWFLVVILWFRNKRQRVTPLLIL